MSRLIGKLLVLIAVLIMPVGMQPATAATHPDVGGATMSMSHCPDQSPSHDSKGGFVECTMACAAALPAVDFPQGEHLLIVRAPSAPAGAQILHGLHPDTAIPPPKAS